MRKIRRDVDDRMPENRKDKEKDNESDQVKKIKDRLEGIYSSVISENDPKLKRIEDDLKDLISIISSFLSERKIKLHSDLIYRDLIDTYKEVIVDLEKNFKLLSEESKVDIKTRLNITPEDLIKDLKDSVNLMLLIYFKRIFTPSFPDDAY